jgi:hypothetical protein
MGRRLGLCLAVLVFAGVAAEAAAEDLKLEATLVWGTNVKDSQLKAVSASLAKKFTNFKWAYYYEIASKEITVGKTESRVPMSADCTLVTRTLNNGQLEVTLIGKGNTVATIQQELRKDGCLVTGGNATNSTGWFIVIKRIE